MIVLSCAKVISELFHMNNHCTVLTFDLAIKWYWWRVWRRERESFPPDKHTSKRSPGQIMLYSSMAYLYVWVYRSLRIINI